MQVKPATRIGALIRAACAGAICFAALMNLRAQQMTSPPLFNFRAQLENHKPPHEAQIKTLLEGAKAQTQPGGRMLITEAKLTTFNTNGATEVIARSPLCTYDSQQDTVGSAGALRVQTGDGRFSIEGRGFLLWITNFNLILSNQVRSDIRSDVLASRGPGRASLNTNRAEIIHVASDSFTYDGNSGMSVYRDHVQAAGTNLQLRAGKLSVEMPLAGTPLKGIVADEDVIIDHGELRTTGDQAVYSASNGLITVTGDPAWRMGRREGRADKLMLDRENNVFYALDRAFLRLPRDTVKTAFLPDSSGTNSLDSTNRFVEIFSDNYEFNTNRAVFSGRVRSTEVVSGKPQGKLNCDLMTISFSGSNEVQKVTAEDDVVVELSDRRVTSRRAVFSDTNSIVEFTGGATWQAGQREGSGDRLLIERVRNEMTVLGNARLKLPASQMRGVDIAPGSSGATTKADNSFANVWCDEYQLKENHGVFRGNARVRTATSRLDADLLTVDFTENPGAETTTAVAQRIRNRVEGLWLDKQQLTNFARADRMVYSYSVANAVTNELVTLTGTPIITNSQSVYTGDPIIWDRIENTIYKRGGHLEHTIQRNTNSPPAIVPPAGPKPPR